MHNSTGKRTDRPVRLGRADILPMAAMVAVFVLSLVLLFAHYRYTKGQMDREFTGQKILAARFAAGQVSRFMEREKSALLNEAGVIAMGGDLVKGKEALALFTRTQGRRTRRFSFNVLDAKGRFLYSYPESMVDRYMQDLSGEGFYRELASGKEFYYSGARDDNRGGLELVLSAPVRGDGGKGPMLGVLVERMDVKALEQMFISGVEAGERGYVFLLDEGGRLVAHQKGGVAYQIENSNEALKKMIRGEEGFVEMESPYSGETQVAVFSPVRFGGKVWSLGIMSPSAGSYDAARRSFERMLLIVGLISLAFAWSILSLTRLSRYRARVTERARASERLLLKNRELTALNDLSRALSGSGDLDGLLGRAVEILAKEIGAKGVAVRLVVPPGGDLELKVEAGMPAGFHERACCLDARQCYCGRVMAGGKPVSLDGAAAAGREDMACREIFPGGLTLVPLAGKSGPLGVLYLLDLGEAEDEADREGFLTALGNQLSAGIENFLQMEDTKRHAARATALFHTARALTRSLDLDVLLKIIMKEAASLLKVEGCLILLYNEEDNRVECRVALGYECPQEPHWGFSPSGVFWDAMADGGVKVVDMNEKNAELPREFRERFGLRRFVLVPLMSKGKVLGFIVLEMPGKGRTPLDDLKLIVGFANQAAVAIETSSFYIRTVEKYNLDLQRLSNKIIEAQEEERKRISRDLHDELGQSLTAIKINLDMVKDKLPPTFEQARTRIGEAVDLVVSTLGSVRRLSFELRPSMLDDLGLSTVLGKLVSDFRKRTGIDVEFTEEGPDERLSPEMEVVFYRVVQEALTNIAKHSGATRVLVDLNKDPEKGMVGLYIEDNGKGFPAQQVGRGQQAKGFGLMGIKERVSLLGGNFRILAAEGSGTKLLVDIPLGKGEQRTWKVT